VAFLLSSNQRQSLKGYSRHYKYCFNRNIQS